METYIVWCRIFLKQQLKKKLYWMQLVLMIAGVCSVSAIRFPDAGNCVVGYCLEPADAKDWFTAELEKQNEWLEFRRYEEKERMYSDIASGRIDCGFVLPPHPQKGAAIERVFSPMSSKYALAELSVFCICYRIGSEDVLMRAEKKLYGSADEARENLLLQKNREIAQSDRIFDIRMVELPARQQAAGKRQDGRLLV